MADAILAHLRRLAKDSSITIKRIIQGSIIMLLEGSREGYERLAALIESKQLTSVSGIDVERVIRPEGVVDPILGRRHFSVDTDTGDKWLKGLRQEERRRFFEDLHDTLNLARGRTSTISREKQIEVLKRAVASPAISEISFGIGSLIFAALLNYLLQQADDKATTEGKSEAISFAGEPQLQAISTALERLKDRARCKRSP